MKNCCWRFKKMENVKIGCCGFPMAQKKYFKKFNIIEIQRTFYQPPKRISTVQRWRKKAPGDFEFTLKAWQLITHSPSSPTYRRLKIDLDNEENYGNFQPTHEVFEAWETIKNMAEILKSKVAVFQCPASFEPTDKNKGNLKTFFKEIDRGGMKMVWEPRGDWKEKEIKELCKEADLIHCVDPFKDKPVYGDIRYYRLHGIGGYQYQYTKENLKKLKKWIKEDFDKKIYVMFNNDSMIEDSKKLEEMLEEE
jgi:uncharacterized protein YecE (DUF72 family)